MHPLLPNELTAAHTSAVVALVKLLAAHAPSANAHRAHPYETLLNLVNQPVILLKPENLQVVWANTAACSLLGMTRDDFEHRSLSDFVTIDDNASRPFRADRISAESAEVPVLSWRPKLTGQPAKAPAKFCTVDAPRGILIAAVLDLPPSPASVIALPQEVDDLTGLPTRAPLRRHLTALLENRGGGRSRVAVLFIDLDGFKRVNDSFGHLAGDYVLSTVAQRLRDSRRPNDMVARYGGDEFVIVIAGIAHQKQTAPIVRRLHKAIQRPIHFGSATITLGASIGAALSRGRPGDSFNALIQRADFAMYSAKQSSSAPLQRS